MDNGNLLSGGVDTLNAIKEHLLELHVHQANKTELAAEEQKLEKNINSLEKAIAEEIQTTTRKRRDEIEAAFDKQIDVTRARIKKIRDKRGKRKNAKISERINTETASLKGENNNLRIEAKALLEQKQIPSFCNTKLFHSLYLPSCFTDFLVAFLAIIIILLLLPCSIYFLILPQEKIFYLIIIYVITVLFFGGIYVFIDNHTKEKYPEEIRQVKAIRKNIRKNKKNIEAIKKDIKKDRDESSYGLQNFDEEINKLEKEASDIFTKKKEALETFDNTTKNVIADEIRTVNEEKLTSLKKEYAKASAESKTTEDKIKELTIKIASEYEPYIGKDLIAEDRLDSLINIIQAGNARNISEAIAFYRQNMKPED